MKNLTRKNAKIEENLPVKVVQFGEGNFLRAFVDYAFQVLNEKISFEAGVAVVQPIETGMVDVLNKQQGLYTLFLQGIKKGEVLREHHLITNIVKAVNPYTDYSDYLALARQETLKFIVSNTTEAGIAFKKTDSQDMTPPDSFPAKLTQFLFERFSHFNGDNNYGLTILPCELINHNADALKEFVLKYIDLWQLGDSFKEWVEVYCDFHNTLVDRIVPGYPADHKDEYEQEIQIDDKLMVSAESYFLWVIEGGEDLHKKIPFHKTELNVRIVKDMQPYRTRKVRILNGTHTAMVPFSLMYGNATVRESMEDDFTGGIIRDMVFEEIIPVLDLDKDELIEFATDVFDRFSNPFIVHQLSSIALNSISKFVVRVLPSIVEYVTLHNCLPVRLTFSLACLIRFYKGEWNGTKLPVTDDQKFIDYFHDIWRSDDYFHIAGSVLGNKELWNKDLTRIDFLTQSVAIALERIDQYGIKKGYIAFSKEIKKVET